MKIPSRAIILLILPLTFSVHAWNTGAHIVNWIQFERSGVIKFTLFENGNSGESFQCHADGGSRLVIEACGSGATECMAASNRMGSALLAARLAGATVHVQNENCIVTEVAVAE